MRVRRHRPRPAAALRLFCLPHAGGGAVLFDPWGEALAPAVDVCAVEAPGRGRRVHEPLVTDLAALADDVVTSVAPLLDRPFALFGHSLGGLVAFEAARRLERAGGPAPVLLVVAAVPAPGEPFPAWHALPDDALVARLRALGGTPVALLDDPEARRVFLPRLRADLAALASYRPTPGSPLGCSIFAVGGQTDGLVPAAALACWRRHTARSFWLTLLPGGHFFVLTERARLLACVAGALAPALAAGASVADASAIAAP